MKSNPFATLAYGAMTLLVAVYIAFVALLMHHDAMPIPVFAGIAFAALAALLDTGAFAKAAFLSGRSRPGAVAQWVTL